MQVGGVKKNKIFQETFLLRIFVKNVVVTKKKCRKGTLKCVRKFSVVFLNVLNFDLKKGKIPIKLCKLQMILPKVMMLTRLCITFNEAFYTNC